MICLNEIATIKSGYIVRKNYSASSDMQEVSVVTAKDIADNFSNLGPAMIPAEYAGFLEDGDLVIKARGNALTSKVFRQKNSKKCVASSTLLIIRLKDKAIMPEFLELIINSEATQKKLQNQLTGALVPALSPLALGELEIPMSSRKNQEQAVQALEIFKKLKDNLTAYLDSVEKIETVAFNKIMEEIYE